VTMSEGTLRTDGVSASDGRLSVGVHLPWYRSLPLSCLEALEVRVDGVPAAVRSVAVAGFSGTVADAASTEAWWDLRDALDVSLDAPARPGDAMTLEVDVAVRIPYMQQAPGVPLVQRAAVRTEATVR
jgi:hypothetical protein